jgi:choice-of-anchor C domain-containing protein
MKILGLIAGAAMLLGAQSAYALAITNGSFDSPAAGNPFDAIGSGSGGLAGWTVGGNGVDHIGNLWQPQNGSSSLDLSGSAGPGHGSISQQLTGLSIGQEYKISFYMSGNIGEGQDTKSLDLGLYDDASLSLASFEDGAGYIYNTLLKNNSNADMKWALQTFTFVASQSAYYLAFFDTSASGSKSGAALDNISISATTPIPPAILLFASALGGMGFLGYRRKKQSAEA